MTTPRRGGPLKRRRDANIKRFCHRATVLPRGVLQPVVDGIRIRSRETARPAENYKAGDDRTKNINKVVYY
ncbi:hypothetical protein MESS2_1250054 [Mesorhizobium metallidurans STM 2683]|uniref:Uncharacterized protein n=1 Tax=Mesorhizobium metallidurans STM 2683 TaxID=1297569 RepID=M5EI47_9HYPH|nr:hypothetical protein MESS2_1250054 [Mesorhizobium metallidurans STM 2683]